MIKYQIRNTRFTSEKFGVCEVCKEFCPKVHHQMELKKYGENDDDWAYTGNDYFGCLECLESMQEKELLAA
jgi:hypothetical protein